MRSRQRVAHRAPGAPEHVVGILIISHGALGEALIQSAGHMLGKPLAGVGQLKVTGRDDPEVLLAQARDLIRQLDQGQGVLVMADIFGATPGNITARLLNAGKVEGVSGASLPMLVRALTYRASPLATVLEKAISGGHEGVVHMNADRCCGPG
jgi:mannose PTS system EIIA component